MTDPPRRSDRIRGVKIVKKDGEGNNTSQVNQQTTDENVRLGEDDGNNEDDKGSEKDKVDEVIDQDEEDNNTLQVNQQTKVKKNRNGTRKKGRKKKEDDEEYKSSDGDDEDDDEDEEEESEVFKLDDATEMAVIQYVEESTASFVKLYDIVAQNFEEKNLSKEIESSSKGEGILYELILSILIKEDYGENNSKLTLQTFGSRPDERKPLFNAIENNHLQQLLNSNFNNIKSMYQKMAKNTCSFLAGKIQSIMMKRPLEGSNVEVERTDTENEDNTSQDDIISETDSMVDVAQAVPEQLFQDEYNFQKLTFSSKHFIQSTKRIIELNAYKDSKFGYLYFILPSSG
jgi:hypothetical protein